MADHRLNCRYCLASPNPAIRLLGKGADIFTKVTGIQLPITGEGMIYASQWVYADSSKAEKEPGITFTDKEQTLAEVYRRLYENGHLSKKKAEKLAL